MAALRIGFLGVAHFHSDSYARALARIPEAKLVGVYEHTERHRRRFAKAVPTKFFRSAEDLISQVDAVVVTAENAKHHGHAVAALEAKKHVLCEKPIAVTKRDGEEMESLARKKGVKFQMCYVMRYHSTAILIKSLIDEGRIGKVLSIVGVNKLNSGFVGKDWFTTKSLSGGGAVMDHSVHLADLMRWYTGSEGKEVYCEIGKNVNTKLRVEDNFLTTVTFRNGAIGHIDGSWSYAAGHYTWGDVALEVLGSEGVLFLDAFRQNVHLTGMKPPNNRLSWHPYGCDPDREMVKGFVEAVRENREPKASATDGLQGLRITLASYESARTGRPVLLD